MLRNPKALVREETVFELVDAPTIVCDVGSRYTREDGGAGTTLYLKETAWNSAVWRAI